jgi:RNA polymerase sigma-32 factor
MNVNVVDSIIRDNPIISHSDQLGLLKMWKTEECKLSLDKLVLSNMRIISKEAFSMKKKNNHLSYDDLVQEGITGVLKAADMFDESHDVNFLTYAMLWVRANMRSHALSYRSVVRMGTTRDDRVLFSNLSKTLREAEALDLTGSSRISFVSKKLNVSEDSVGQMMISIKGHDTRLDAPVRNSEGSETLRIDMLEDTSGGEGRLMEGVGLSSKKNILKRIVSTLPDDERKILKARYLTDDPKTLRELEGEMSISREWIRKLEMRGLDRVKKRLSSEFGVKNILDI